MIALIPVAIAAILATAAPALDTVFLRNGGRLRGTVVEEDPAKGISIQLPTGEVRKLLPSDIARVEYGDGSAGAVEVQKGPVKGTPQAVGVPSDSPPPSAAPVNDARYRPLAFVRSSTADNSSGRVVGIAGCSA